MNPDDAQKALREGMRQWDAAHKMTEPDWEPLERLLGPDLCAGFMFMGYEAGPQGSGGIRLYKHGLTRRYLNLDAHGRAYRYRGEGTYEPMPLGEALAEVFRGLQVAEPYNEAYRRRRDDALRRAGWSVLRVTPREEGDGHGC